MKTELTHKQIERAKEASYKRFANFVHKNTWNKEGRLDSFGIDWDDRKGYFIIENSKTGKEKCITLNYSDLVNHNILTPILRKYYEGK